MPDNTYLVKFLNIKVNIFPMKSPRIMDSIKATTNTAK